MSSNIRGWVESHLSGVVDEVRGHRLDLFGKLFAYLNKALELCDGHLSTPLSKEQLGKEIGDVGAIDLNEFYARCDTDTAFDKESVVALSNSAPAAAFLKVWRMTRAGKKAIDEFEGKWAATVRKLGGDNSLGSDLVTLRDQLHSRHKQKLRVWVTLACISALARPFDEGHPVAQAVNLVHRLQEQSCAPGSTDAPLPKYIQSLLKQAESLLPAAASSEAEATVVAPPSAPAVPTAPALHVAPPGLAAHAEAASSASAPEAAGPEVARPDKVATEAV